MWRKYSYILDVVIQVNTNFRDKIINYIRMNINNSYDVEVNNIHILDTILLLERISLNRFQKILKYDIVFLIKYIFFFKAEN